MLPDKVKVAGIEYTVEQVSFVEIDGSRNYNGVCWYDQTKIELIDDISAERKKEVFVHEMLHAIFNEAGYDEQDEDMIVRVGKVLHQVLRDNDFNWLKS